MNQDSSKTEPDVETLLRQLRLERLQGRDGDVYVSPRAKATPEAADDFDLTTKVQEFLASDGKVFLVLGDSGTGKSTFNGALEISLWDKHDKINGRIPLFIHLPAIKEPERDLIAERLRQINFTESQILELKLHREFILICDGYDESQQIRNLYMSNQLNQPNQWRAQMVISCRTEYIGVDYKDLFQPTDPSGGGDRGQFQEAIISPFTKEQIRDYVGQYVSLQKSPWEFEDYLRVIEQIPNVQDLVKYPFFLKLSLEALPRLSKTNTRFPSTNISRVQLYDELVAQWIDRSKARFMEMELSPHDREIFKRMTESGFQECGITYLKELATAIYEHQGGNPVVHYSAHDGEKTWKEAFFDEKDGSHLLREVIPLTRNGDQYRFIHKSLLEYGLSLAVFGPSKLNEETGATILVSRRESASSDLSFENSSSTERTTANDGFLLDSPLGKRSLVGEPSVLQFLTERVQQEPVFKDQLHSVIERSKADKKVWIAAANAITILVRAGVQFNGADLRGIKIPGADLSFGVFDSAQLEGADLRKTNLRNVWMRQANLRGAQMKGVQFGELPFLSEDSKVVCGVYSPDGKTYAAGLSDGGISLYETSSWNRMQRFKGHSDEVKSLSFSATSDLITSGSSDGTVRLWDVDTGKCVHTLQGHGGATRNVVHSPKGGWIASGSDDGTVQLWDVDTGECTHILQGHQDSVSSVVYSPKGDRVASGSWDSTVWLWDVDTGECVHTFQGHRDNVNSVAYSPRGDRIISGSSDSTVRLWDVDTGECIHTLQGHSGRVCTVMYSPRGDQIASGSDDKTVRLWDVDTSECLHALQGHSGRVCAVMYSPKGDWIASGSIDKTVRLWNADTGKGDLTLHGHNGAVSSVVYSPKGDQIASGSDDGTVRLWNVDTGECVHTLQSYSQSINSVVYSSESDRIASGGDDKTVRFWDVDTGKCIQILQGHGDVVNCVVYSPKGDWIASGSDDSTVRLWDANTGECVHTLQGHRQSVNSVAYSPKGDRIASGGGDSIVRLWDVDTGKCIHILQGHIGPINSVAYSPKEDQIASGSLDSTVRLWDVDTGECVHTLQSHGCAISKVVYSPNGDRIAFGSDDGTVRLWDVDTGGCVRALQGHSGVVRSVVYMYSPNGDQIASGSDDKTMRLWNVETGQCLATISGFSGSVTSIALKSDFDSQCLVTGNQDKSVRRWRIIEEGDKHKAVLCWSSSHMVLTVCDLSFEDVQGLSQSDRSLLIQRGAFVPAPAL